MRSPTPRLVTCGSCGRARPIKFVPGAVCRSCHSRRTWETRRDSFVALRDHQAAAQAYIDDVAVDRLVAGDRPARTTRAERQAAVERLSRRGWPVSRIARHVGLTDRSVGRLRARAGLTEPRPWQVAA